MSKEFLPEWCGKAMETRDGYRALYRLFEGDAWKMVSKNGRPLVFAQKAEARAAARALVKQIINPTLRTMHAEAAPVDDEVEAWRRDRDAAIEAERASVFRDMPTSAVKGKRGNLVRVERRRARRGIAAE